MSKIIETNTKAIVAEKVLYAALLEGYKSFVVCMDNGDHIEFSYDDEEESVENYMLFVKRLKGEEGEDD